MKKIIFMATLIVVTTLAFNNKSSATVVDTDGRESINSADALVPAPAVGAPQNVVQ